MPSDPLTKLPKGGFRHIVEEKQAARDLTIEFLPGMSGEIAMARRGYQSGDVPPAEGEPVPENEEETPECPECNKHWNDCACFVPEEASDFR